jgi:hypothetical protein
MVSSRDRVVVEEGGAGEGVSLGGEVVDGIYIALLPDAGELIIVQSEVGGLVAGIIQRGGKCERVRYWT